jgi:integrase
VVVAAHWRWSDVAALLLIGFLGMLRPGEGLALRFADVTFTTSSRGLVLAFVFVGSQKTRRLAARRQHVRLDDQFVVPLLAAAWPKSMAALQRRIFGGSRLQWNSCFTALVRELHLEGGMAARLTPACLRPGGATWYYQETDSPEQVRFRGRWLSSRMLEIHIQEVAGGHVPQRPLPRRA